MKDDMVDGNESWFSVANQLNVTLSSNVSSISEPTVSATLTATLDNTSSADVVVNLTYTGTATNATDYSGAASITISAGSLTGTTAITAIDDTDVELTETIIVDMGDVSGASESGSQQVMINLISDDYPNVTLDYSKTSFAENESTAVTATLDSVHSKATQIYLYLTGTATLLTDYNVVEESNTVILNKTFDFNRIEITIPAGTKIVTTSIYGVEDGGFDDEEDETIILTPSVTNGTLASSDATTLTLLNNSITVTRKDDPFIGLSKGSVSWGDFDRDGDKDVAIMGQSNTAGAIIAIYENKNGEFVNTNQNFAKLYDGDLSWVDINKDGYLDLIVSGINNQIPQTKVYLSKEKATYFEPTEDYGLPQLFSTTMDWGDLDNDGDIDLAISGIDADNNYVFDIYYRENGKQNFIKEKNYSGSGFSNGDLLIADLDLDGDNDIIFSGENSNGNTVGGFTRNTIFKGARSINSNSLKNSSIGVYYEPNMKTLVISHIGENSSGNVDSSSSSAMGIPLALKNGDISYADYNNDGYIDYVVSGEDDNGNSITKLYNGDWPSQAAEPTFSESSVELVGLRESTVNWVDYDMDGDLDLFLTGINSNGAQSILYETEIRNKKNKSPEKITGLEVEDLGYGKVKFKWDEPSDDYSSGGLGYVLRLGTTAGGSELSNTLSNLESGERLISESPAIFNNYFETQLEPGTYYYSVQAVDSGLKGGLFSEESSYTLTYEWKELNQGGIVDRTISAKENPILKLGDLDNDNDLDLIYGSLTSGSPTVLKFDGFRLVSENQNILNGASTITDAEIGDVNGDGTTDILLNNFTSNGSNNLKIYLSDNSGGFTSVNLDSGLYKAKGRILDLNNDGQSEITIVGLTSDNSSGIPKFYVFEYDKNANSFNDKIDLSSQIASLKSSSFDLGDVDNDQDIDFIISGFDESQGLLSYIYKNETNLGGDYVLTKTNNNLVAIRDGTVDFIDFDGDGDLDGVFTGTGKQGDIFEIYKNDLNEGKENWPRIELGLKGMRNGKIDLGDFNGDGYADLLYSGLQEGIGETTELAQYNPETNQFEKSDFDVSDFSDAEVEFGDLDGDGDLDFAISGKSKSLNTQVFKAYLNKRNESATVLENQDSGIAKQTSRFNSSTFVINKPPSVPDGLVTKIISDEVETGNVAIEFSWDASTDDLTKSTGLTYAIKIGTSDGGEEIMSANANSNGKRKSANKGNVEHNLSWKLSLPIGSYYWSVQAIDASFLGSSFSTSKSFAAGSDKDGDGIIDDNDNCPDTANSDQADIDGDGTGDVCDDDRDGDGIANAEDNCPDVSNADQADADGDGTGDVCDDDRDGDDILNTEDNCPDVSNADQADADSDGTGDVCDDDRDGDGIANADDNCPDVSNADQADSDSDGTGDVCDDDRDGDGILNTEDNCPDVSNADQADADGDGTGDVCDDDRDGDGILNTEDNCPDVSNADQADADGDGTGDVCDDDRDGDDILNTEDNCPDVSNADQADADGDGTGDVCDDSDGDGVYDSEDNCPKTANADQADTDADGIGDVCDDSDGDGVIDLVDACPDTPAGSTVDLDGCAIFTLPLNNNKVSVTSASCIGTTDGSIGLSIEDASYNYTVSITGQDDPVILGGETKTASVTGLGTGTYTVCFKVDGQEAYEQCFEVNIGEPKALKRL